MAIPNNMYLSPAPPPKQTSARHGKQDALYTGRSGTTPHGKNKSIARAGIESKLVLSGMIIRHKPPPDTAVELCMPCQALSK